MSAAPFPITYNEAGAVSGGRPGLIFMHGIGGDADAFRFQLDHFAAAYHAVAWNMPGYRGSAAIDPVTFPRLAAALAALLDHLGMETAHLVGHSIGGMVAQEMAALYPERIAGLVLAQTSPAFGRPDGDFQKRFVADRLGPLDEGRGMEDIAGEVIETMFPPGAEPQAVGLARDAMAAVPEDTYRAVVQCLVTFDRRDNLGNIGVPTLVLAGERDANAPAGMMEKMAGRIPGARYHCMPGANHLANLECPDLFNGAIQQFLDRI